MKTRAFCWCLALTLAGCTGDASKKIAERQKALEAAKAAEQSKKDASKPAGLEEVKLGVPWESPDYVVIRSDGPCPDGLWALFDKGEVPGANKDEKKANAAKRGELAKALREKTFLVKLRAPEAVKLKPYDAPKGEFPLEVGGTIDCSDSIGRIAIAWSTAKAGSASASAAQEGNELTENVWMVEPLQYALPMKSVADAKEFDSKHRLGMSARVVLKLGKVEIDRKLKKVVKFSQKAHGEDLAFGGGAEDWGAGRLVHADISALRIAIEREKTSLIEKK